MSEEIRFAPLFSGSSGNAIYVGCGNTHVLVDAGVSGTRVLTELRRIGVNPDSLTAILTTHEHNDHIKGVGILSRRLHVPVYATRGTWVGMQGKIGAVQEHHCCVMEAGVDFYLGDMNILPFATPHDANEPIGLCFEHRGARFAVATDLGAIKKGWMNSILGCDAVLLESNYDPDMLETGSYPYELKRRIASAHGHLCNDDAGRCAVDLVEAGAKQIILGHLSKENNFPELALKCTQGILLDAGIRPGEDVRVDVARRDETTGMFAISSY